MYLSCLNKTKAEIIENKVVVDEPSHEKIKSWESTKTADIIHNIGGERVHEILTELVNMVDNATINETIINTAVESINEIMYHYDKGQYSTGHSKKSKSLGKDQQQTTSNHDRKRTERIPVSRKPGNCELGQTTSKDQKGQDFFKYRLYQNLLYFVVKTTDELNEESQTEERREEYLSLIKNKIKDKKQRLCYKNPELAKKKAIVNVRNEDNRCFQWALLSALHENEVHKNHAYRLNYYRKWENELNVDGIESPVFLNAIDEFKRQNSNFNINVFGFDGVKKTHNECNLAFQLL
ncbi:Hypothetical predicted protein [Mytilus galloprovincialis]|uniref:Uncharacterized protein n=1 Tax=Mytilus galloprovincialis TaxID=29158 RepID=A0A8B6H1J4_MYTGA|nr:Hypothetical predicted protein [Mytilus galloprovincialis]